MPHRLKQRAVAHDDGPAQELQRLLSRHLAELSARKQLLRGDIALEPGESRADLESSADTLISDAGAALLEATSRTVQGIQDALRRLDTGTYGICMDCNAPIPAARLAALPFANRCCDCQQQHDSVPRFRQAVA